MLLDSLSPAKLCAVRSLLAVMVDDDADEQGYRPHEVRFKR